MNGTALDYIREKGFQHRIRGKEIILQECPFCGDTKSHFYLDSQEGQFFCHKCQEKGNLITLQKHLGDYESKSRESWGGNPPRKPQGSIKQAFPAKQGQGKVLDENVILQTHERLLADAEGMAYLEGRGITPETVRAFKLGLQVDGDGSRWLDIPHYSRGRAVNIKSRTLPPERNFRRVTGCPSVLFNLDAVQGLHEIFLTEGEIDCMTLVQNKFPNSVGATGGAGNFDPSWVDALKPFKKVFIIYDPDEAGQKGAREVARRLGYDRCFNVVLPEGQDVNEFFQDYGAPEFADYVSEARQFDVSGVMSVEEGLRKLQSEIQKPQRTGLFTPWASVNKRFRQGFLPGELIVIGAPPKIGKSTFCLQIAAANALAGISSLFFCLEMPFIKVVEKIIQCQTKTEIIGPSQIRACDEINVAS